MGGTMPQHPDRLPITIVLLLLVIPFVSTPGCQLHPRPPEAPPGPVAAILERAGLEEGLIVVVGCGDASLLADLRRAGPFVVQGLDADPQKVTAARRYLWDQKLYSRSSMTVSRLREGRFPFGDGLVDLIIVTDDSLVSASEMDRVLSARGVIATMRRSDAAISRKERPDQREEWHVDDPSPWHRLEQDAGTTP